MPSVADHPLAALRRAGVRCSLNADDTLVFDTDLAAEYRLAREVLGLDDADLADIARTSLDVSGAPRSVVDAGIRGIDAWLTPPGGGAAAIPYALIRLADAPGDGFPSC